MANTNADLDPQTTDLWHVEMFTRYFYVDGPTRVKEQ